MVKIKFIKDTEKCKEGEVKESSKKSAENYVSQGFAEYVDEPTIELDLDNPSPQKGMMYIKIIKKNPLHKKGSVVPLMENYGKQLIKEKLAVEVDFEEYKKDQQDKLAKMVNKAIEKEKLKYSMQGLRIDNFLRNVELFADKQPFFYESTKLFWFWNEEEKKWAIVDEVDLMIALESILDFNGQTINTGIKNQYLEAFKRVGRNRQPKDAKKKWIQFKDIAYDLKGHTHKVDHKYFFTNPIPWKIGKSSDTPTMDKLIAEWVGEKYLNTIYEILAYCTYRDYPIQSMICLYGAGCNGKSQLLKLIDRFIGSVNVVTTDLDMIAGRTKSRFEIFKLYKKLVCLMGETNFGMLNNTSILKRLTGSDKIGFEKKGKDPFDDYSYAKMLIASNSLPSSEDTSDGFYRRWLIIKFPNEFKEGKDIIDTIPKEEYENLAKKVTEVLPELLNRGYFTNQGTIEHRKEQYILASNPLPVFVRDFCKVDESSYCSYSQFYVAYTRWLIAQKKRKVNMKEFRNALENEGFFIERTSKKSISGDFKAGNWINGVELKGDYANYANYTQIATPKYAYKGEVQNDAQIAQFAQKSDLHTYFQRFPNKNIHEDELKKLCKSEESLWKWLEDLKKVGDIMLVRPFEWRLVE